MNAHEALTRALLDLADAGGRPPCAAEPDRWSADDREIRAEAAGDCAACPILGPCRTAGDGESHHVWGGVDRTKPPPTRKATHDERKGPQPWGSLSGNTEKTRESVASLSEIFPPRHPMTFCVCKRKRAGLHAHPTQRTA